MTREVVQQAMTVLQTQGTPVSARNVLRILRNAPPHYRGYSFRDLLPLLKNQADTLQDPRYQAVIDAAAQLEDVVARGHHGQLSGGIARAEHTWQTCATAMYQASARGDPMAQLEAWAAAFERLRLACSAAIGQHAGSSRKK
jgi:hypothetical protein